MIIDITEGMTQEQIALLEQKFTDLSELQAECQRVFGRKMPWINCLVGAKRDENGCIYGGTKGYRISKSRLETEKRVSGSGLHAANDADPEPDTPPPKLRVV